ncbi:MAG: putative capsular polysaccharide synthesis family protein [Clostridia bacterium]
MIKLSRLTAKDMNIYINKKVVLLGKNPNLALNLYHIFNHFNIEVVACCCDNIYNEKKRFCSTKFLRMRTYPKFNKIIKHSRDFKKFIDDENIIVQQLDIMAEYIEEYKMIAISSKVKISPYFAGELMNSFNYINVFRNFNSIYTIKKIKLQVKKFLFKNKKNTELIKYCEKNNPQKPIFICSPQKTADHSLIFTFNFLNKENKIEYHNLWHQPRNFSKKYLEDRFEKIRVIFGIREPISQNISTFFQKISGSGIDYSWVNGYLNNKTKKERKDIVKYYYSFIEEKGNNVQELWNEFVPRYIYTLDSIYEDKWNCIQGFIPEYSKYILNITKYPFNKEEGYTIIKEGNMEVFVYQLEKLNNLVPELSDFIGVPFTELVRGNDASDKWIADSYKQAQKEIEITEDYFDRCYNEPYVKHCYSEAAIEKFKERWRPHIK